VKKLYKRIRSGNYTEALNFNFEEIPEDLFLCLSRADEGCGTIMFQDLPMNHFDINNVRSLEAETLDACELIEENPLTILPTCYAYLLASGCTGGAGSPTGRDGLRSLIGQDYSLNEAAGEASTPMFRVPTHIVGVGALDVFFDGYKLIEGRDYIDVDENYIRILQSAPAGTRIEVAVYSSQECDITQDLCAPPIPTPVDPPEPDDPCWDNVISNFNTSAQGWTATRGILNYNGITNDIDLTNDSSIAPAYLIAPADYRGDLTDYRQLKITAARENDNSATGTLIVYLYSTAGTAYYDTGVTPGYASPTTVVVPLDDPTDWVITGTWADIISDVTDLQITATFHNTIERNNFDDIILISTTPCEYIPGVEVFISAVNNQDLILPWDAIFSEDTGWTLDEPFTLSFEILDFPGAIDTVYGDSSGQIDFAVFASSGTAVDTTFLYMYMNGIIPRITVTLNGFTHLFHYEWYTVNITFDAPNQKVVFSATDDTGTTVSKDQTTGLGDWWNPAGDGWPSGKAARSMFTFASRNLRNVKWTQGDNVLAWWPMDENVQLGSSETTILYDRSGNELHGQYETGPQLIWESAGWGTATGTDLTITNPSMAGDSSSVAGWTQVQGTLVSDNTNNPADTNVSWFGDYYFYWTNSAIGEAYQDVACSGFDGQTVAVTWYQSTFSDDTATIDLAFLDSGDNIISQTSKTEIATSPDNTWIRQSNIEVIPAGTEKLRIIMRGTRVSGVNIAGWIDYIQARVLD
jgi:hypothetical protein